jgi:hypothetical protein
MAEKLTDAQLRRTLGAIYARQVTTLKEIGSIKSVLAPLAKIGEEAKMPAKIPSYEMLEVPLDKARNWELVDTPGDTLTAATDGLLTGIEVRLDKASYDSISFASFNPIVYSKGFEKFYLTNSVQAGKKLWVFLGREAGASAAAQVLSAEFKNKVSAIVARTTSLLGAAGEYIASAFSLEENARIIGSCFADQNGTIYVEQRNDGTNWDVQSPFTYPASQLLGFSVEVVGNEGRIRFVNSATPQTSFRLYCRLRRV